MHEAPAIHRHADGSIDVDFYRRQATEERRAARARVFRALLNGCTRAAASLRQTAVVRPVWPASAVATLLCAAVITSAWSQSGHPHHIAIRADEMKWTAGPPSLPAGAQVVMLEGNPAKAEPLTMRLKFPAGYKLPPHTHPAIEHVTVLTGTFHVGAGDTFDESRGTRMPTGSFFVMPVGMTHFAWASEETVIQLHSVGPWGITYANPADDPRKK